MLLRARLRALWHPMQRRLLRMLLLATLRWLVRVLRPTLRMFLRMLLPPLRMLLRIVLATLRALVRILLPPLRVLLRTLLLAMLRVLLRVLRLPMLRMLRGALRGARLRIRLRALLRPRLRVRLPMPGALRRWRGVRLAVRRTMLRRWRRDVCLPMHHALGRRRRGGRRAAVAPLQASRGGPRLADVRHRQLRPAAPLPLRPALPVHARHEARREPRGGQQLGELARGGDALGLERAHVVRWIEETHAVRIMEARGLVRGSVEKTIVPLLDRHGVGVLGLDESAYCQVEALLELAPKVKLADDDAAMQAARERQDQLTKPSGRKGDACLRRSWVSWPSR